MTAPPAIEIKRLTKIFPVHAGLFSSPVHMIAVDNVSLAMPAGSVLGVVGELACGKSTLARLILAYSSRLPERF